MPIFTQGDKSLLFIHIPKCAGSSVEKIGAELGWAESFSIRGKPLSQIAYCKASFQHLHASVLSELFHLDRFDGVFTLVRHPFDRLKSEYYWQRHQSITHLDVGDWIDDTFARYRGNAYLYDNHVRPQVEFIPEYSGVLVFRVEQGGVNKARQLFETLAPERASRGVAFTGVEEKKSPKDALTELTFERYRDRISTFYEADFDAFGYYTS